MRSRDALFGADYGLLPAARAGGSCGPGHRDPNARLRPEQFLPENIASVVIDVRVLLAREVANQYARVDTPRVEELVPDFRHENEFLVDREGDVALVEKVVNVRGQQQAVRAI